MNPITTLGCVIGGVILICCLLGYLAYWYETPEQDKTNNVNKSLSLPSKSPKLIPPKPSEPSAPKPEPTYFDLGPQCRKTKHISYSQPLYISKSLMTVNEQGWYDALVSYFKYKGYYVFPQICLRSIIDKTYNTDRFMELFHMVDFVITDSSMQVLYAVEINDRSHQLPDRKERDEKVAAILETANIPLVTFASMESLANIPTKFDNKKALL